ncbi:MAG: APC family permease, partial [Hyphomicrobiales bacterium]
MAAKSASAASNGGQGRATVSTGTAIAICVADMVGIGVFTSLGFQVLDITAGFSILLLWLVGGLAALSGALSYAELGAMFPRSGGEYNFLSRSYHPAFGFMAGWLSATVGFAAPVALAAMAFGSYAEGVWADAPKLLLGVALVWGVTLVHLLGVEHGSRFLNISTVLKVALILACIAAGLALGDPLPVSCS